MPYYAQLSQDYRIKSYDYIENFIAEIDWSQWGIGYNTDTAETEFSRRIHAMSSLEFQFLLLHCGYIPDYYGKDSSQETLYSKLVESMVCEWAKRIGFNQSFLQKQKSNKEDITIMKDGNVIVCDAKSFRLGRSQAAPNVKDTIKKQAYATWLNAYPHDKQIGGLTTFPSMHDWKKGGEAYYYYTEGNPSIMLLFYEHMAFFLNQSIEADSIISFLGNYNAVYPVASKEKGVYWKGVYENLLNENWNDYWTECTTYTQEKAKHTIDTLQNKINTIKQDVDGIIATKSHEELIELAKQSIIEHRASDLLEQIHHIRNFRGV